MHLQSKKLCIVLVKILGEKKKKTQQNKAELLCKLSWMEAYKKQQCSIIPDRELQLLSNCITFKWSSYCCPNS